MLNPFYTPRCMDALFGVRILFRNVVQSPEVIPDSIPPIQSPVMFTQVTERPWEIDTRVPIFIQCLRSLKTPETPGLSIRHSFGLYVFRNERLLNLLLLILQDFLLLSYLHIRSQNAFMPSSNVSNSTDQLSSTLARR